MRDMIFPTSLTHHQMIQRQAVMRPAAVAAAARDFTFWQRTHAVYSSMLMKKPGAPVFCCDNGGIIRPGCIHCQDEECAHRGGSIRQLGRLTVHWAFS